MRITSGKAKGRILHFPKSAKIRPTSDKVKESLFNMLGDKVEDSLFLDLCSGTGSIGLEAFSRKAREVTMVDSNLLAKRIIYKNIEKCGFMDELNKHLFYFPKDALWAIDKFSKNSKRFDFIYLDPPYKEKNLYEEVMNRICEGDILVSNGILIVEHYFKNGLENQYNEMKCIRCRTLGDTSLSFYKKT